MDDDEVGIVIFICEDVVDEMLFGVDVMLGVMFEVRVLKLMFSDMVF